MLLNSSSKDTHMQARKNINRYQGDVKVEEVRDVVFAETMRR